MKRITFFFALVVLVGLNSCKSRKDAIDTAVDIKDTSAIPESIVVDDFSAYKDGASTTITSVTIEENTMIIKVSYSGGCEKHEFTLAGSKLIQKSLPPKRGIMLYHKNNGDSCRSIVEEELHFNITNLAYDSKETMLLLEGWKTPVSYIPATN